MNGSVRETLAAHGLRVRGIAELGGGFGGTTLRADTTGGALVVKVRPDPRRLRVTRTVAAVLAYRGVPHPRVVLPPTPTTAGWILGRTCSPRNWICCAGWPGRRTAADRFAVAALLTDTQHRLNRPRRGGEGS